VAESISIISIFSFSTLAVSALKTISSQRLPHSLQE
jgi:hypothetical protein